MPTTAFEEVTPRQPAPRAPSAAAAQERWDVVDRIFPTVLVREMAVAYGRPFPPALVTYRGQTTGRLARRLVGIR